MKSLSALVSVLFLAAYAPTFASLTVPLITDPDQRMMVGEYYGLGAGPAEIWESGKLRVTDAVVLFLVRPGFPQSEAGVPDLVEVREAVEDAASYLDLPLRWILWSSTGDGVLNWKAPVTGFVGRDQRRPVFGRPIPTHINIRQSVVEKTFDVGVVLREAPRVPPVETNEL